MEKMNLLGISRQEMADFIARLNEKPFRVTQIWIWLYQKGVRSFNEMSNISKAFRQVLDREAEIGRLSAEHIQRSSSGTRKYLWRLADGECVESVYIPETKRRTVCLSTQVGCALKCAFCATGKLGFTRNLTPFEIVGQLMGVIDDVGEKPSNLVIMGMGEPMLNYDNLIKALTIINDREGLAIGHRKITISTAGIVPGLLRYANEGHPFRIAISLNATTPTLRNELMPVNKKYPLPELLKAAKTYTEKSGKRLTFEYVLIKGVNDTPGDIRRLLSMLKGIPCKVNLIPYNSTGGRFQRPSDESVKAFADAIRPLCAPVTLRLSRGDDINGACGQLAGK